MKRLCTICARGGSKGLVGKNTKELLGEPLVAYSIVQARNSGLFSHIAVSSDCLDIRLIAAIYGADMVIARPNELATDKSGKIPAIIHAIERVEDWIECQFNTVVDLDATSPLRSVQDIINCVELLEKSKVSNVITGTPSHRSPEFNMIKLVQGVPSLAIQPVNAINCRQQSTEYYDLNASIYVWNRDKLVNDPQLFYDDTAFYEMPRERSVDIDDIIDFQIVEMIMKNRLN